MIIVSRFWTAIFSLGKANAITIFPFILVKNLSLRNDRILINHEKVHLRQAAELGIIPFYVWYLLEFLIRFVYYRDFYRAYRAISFEREAYANERDFGYLSQRKHYSFWRYR